jgi:hypothetical protein
MAPDDLRGRETSLKLGARIAPVIVRCRADLLHTDYVAA